MKRVRIQDFDSVRANGLNAMDLEPGDELCWVKLANSADDVILVSARGKAVRFSLEDVRTSNRGSGGVRGMRLLDGDVLVGAEVVEPEAAILLVTEHGYGKRTKLDQFPPKGRGTQGVIALTTTTKTGLVAATCLVRPEDEVMVISAEGVVIRMAANTVSLLGRAAQGVRVMHLDPSDRVVSTTRLRVNGT